jgi:hypothetical protein
MERLEGDVMREGVVMLDAAVVHDIATALTGSWVPEDEADDDRRAELLAAGRLRIFADRDQYGLVLAATADARELAMGYDNAAWSIGFIQDVSTVDGAPLADDVAGLERLLRDEGIVGASASALAYAILFPSVSYVITSDPAGLKHQRSEDRPDRLEIVTPTEAVTRLGLIAGEIPLVGPPAGSPLDGGPHWWLPT